MHGSIPRVTMPPLLPRVVELFKAILSPWVEGRKNKKKLLCAIVYQFKGNRRNWTMCALSYFYSFWVNLVFCFLPASDFDSGFKASKSTWGEKWIKGNFLLGPLHLIILKKKIIGLANLFNMLVYKLKRIYPCWYMSLLAVWTWL